jgi:hypothetical protein
VPSQAVSVDGFRIEPAAAAVVAKRGFEIRRGHYYVAGILCENDEDQAAYFAQPDYFPDPAADALPGGRYLVYLDVWEHHVTYVEHSLLREVALGGPDTASRARIVWQVKVAEPPDAGFSNPPTFDEITLAVQGRSVAQRPRMRARTKPGDVSTTPCVMPSSSGYRGRENQLYRVEVHQGGPAGTATFKWSRDNGSITFPIVALSSTGATVETLGLDPTRSLQAGDWVELLDDVVVLHGRAGLLARVQSVDDSRQVRLVPAAGGVGTLATALSPSRRPFLRRWDHRGAPPAGGTIMVTESGDPDLGWIDLEDGIQVQFAPQPAGARYVTGDYWTIAARTATGSIEWQTEAGAPAAREPQGVDHHYAPLALMNGANIDTRLRKILTTNPGNEPA